MDKAQFLDTIKNIATVTGCGISLFTFCGLLIKPLRKRLVSWFVKVTYRDRIAEIEKQVADIKQEKAEYEKHNKELLVEIIDKLNELNKRTFENERDRLRGELFNTGNRCRRGQALYPDEFRYIQAVYDKYTNELHENSIGTDEYNFIRDYFESPQNQEMIHS